MRRFRPTGRPPFPTDSRFRRTCERSNARAGWDVDEGSCRADGGFGRKGSPAVACRQGCRPLAPRSRTSRSCARIAPARRRQTQAGRARSAPRWSLSPSWSTIGFSASETREATKRGARFQIAIYCLDLGQLPLRKFGAVSRNSALLLKIKRMPPVRIEHRIIKKSSLKFQILMGLAEPIMACPASGNRPQKLLHRLVIRRVLVRRGRFRGRVAFGAERTLVGRPPGRICKSTPERAEHLVETW